MTQAHKTPGNFVKLKDECYTPKSMYYGYVDYLKGHFFEVLDVPHPGHVMLKCITGLKDEKDNSLPLKVCFHDDSIVSLSLEEKHSLTAKHKSMKV